MLLNFPMVRFGKKAPSIRMKMYCYKRKIQ